MDTINLTSLRADIRELPRLAYSDHETWRAWCADRGFGKGANGHFIPMQFSDVATGLYTLRAYLRGRLHRLNPPAPVRDFNRSMRDTDRKHLCVRWNRIDWNRDVAHKFATHYPFVVETVAELVEATA